MSGQDTPLTPSQVTSQERKAAQEGWAHQVLVSLDQAGNVIGSPIFLLQKGLPDETISSHVRRIMDDPDAKHKLVAGILNHVLNEIQANHGAKAEAGDLERADAVQSTEKQALDD